MNKNSLSLITNYTYTCYFYKTQKIKAEHIAVAVVTQLLYSPLDPIIKVLYTYIQVLYIHVQVYFQNLYIHVLVNFIHTCTYKTKHTYKFYTKLIVLITGNVHGCLSLVILKVHQVTSDPQQQLHDFCLVVGRTQM